MSFPRVSSREQRTKALGLAVTDQQQIKGGLTALYFWFEESPRVLPD